MSLKILSLNIGRPSKKRAIEQIKWLDSRKEDVFILTESKNAEGCNLISSHFKNIGGPLSRNHDFQYHVLFPRLDTDDLGVMCVSKVPVISSTYPFPREDRFHMRYLQADLAISDTTLRLSGVYVPSRDESEIKIERKKSFINGLTEIIKTTTPPNIIAGDFNIIDRKHIPRYSKFKEWEYDFYDMFIKMGYVDAFRFCNPTLNEYSWVGRTGDGYRYDYFFVDSEFAQKIEKCNFLHTPRESGISDHSAIILELKM